MKQNPDALALQLIVPGKVAWIYNYYFFIAGLALVWMLAYGHSQKPYFLPLTISVWVPLFVWAYVMGVAHKKAGAVLLAPEFMIVSGKDGTRQTFFLKELQTIFFYIDGAAADTPAYTVTRPANGSRPARETVRFMEVRTGLENRLEFTVGGQQHQYHVLLLDRHMDKLQTLLYNWQMQGYPVKVEDRSGRNLSYLPD